MTAAAERALPIRVPITPGEALDSWMEALARRNGMTVGHLLPVLGWRVPATHDGLVRAVPAPTLRRIERQTGCRPGRLDDAVLDRFAWCRRPPAGTRFCPYCLNDFHGRWPLVWRLPWVFACTTHQVLLCSTCPGCRQAPRRALSLRAGAGPAACCPNALARRPSRQLCATDLRAVPAHPLTGDDPRLVTHRHLDDLLAAVQASPPACDTPNQVFTDLTAFAGWLLPHLTDEDLHRFGPDLQRAYHAHRAVTGRMPTDPAVIGALAATVMPLVTGDSDARLVEGLQALLGRDTKPRPLELARRSLSDPSRRRVLHAADPYLEQVDRIRYHSATAAPRVPDADIEVPARRARHVPQLLWPQWTVRLLPARSFVPDTFRSAVSACLLLPGLANRAASKTHADLHSHRGRTLITGVLRRLAHEGHHAVFAAICHLADYLDAHPVSIDYQRRRDLVPPAVITGDDWWTLCYQAGVHPGGRGDHAPSRRLFDAQRYLYQLLTGADLTDPRHTLAFRSATDRTAYLSFTASLPTVLRQALHHHAADQLRRLGIDEPLTWHPPLDCCRDLDLPGRHPDDIDLADLHRIVITENRPLGHAAEQLDTTIEHIRFALEHLHIPAPPPPARANADPWKRLQQAHLLTAEFFEREYVQAGKRLQQLQTETGIHRGTLARHAHRAGIPLAVARQPTHIDPGWLREQYQQRKRSFSDIAAELGVTDLTVIGAAHRHGIPSRPPGVHSRPELITVLGKQIPRDIRSAVEGQLHGWQRLRRFQQAMAFSTLHQAAEHLPTGQPALVTQFKRLERDVGAKLYHRATHIQPMRPTRRGAALLRAMARPGVHALLEEHDRSVRISPRT